MPPVHDGSSLLKDYDPAVFSALADFPFARARLADTEGEIDRVGAVICKYRFHDVVGLNLLHKHFELAPDEIIVRYFDDNTAYMSPFSACRDRRECVPYLWAYVPNHDDPGWYPVEFVATDHLDATDLVLLEHANVMLVELGETLVSLGLESVFGIAALFSRSALQLPPGHTLLETTDEANRLLTLRPVPEDVVRQSDTTKTLWIFDPHPN